MSKLFRNALVALALLVPLGLCLAAAPAHAQLAPIVQDSAPAAINISTATTTKIVSNTANKKTYITYMLLIAGGTGNVTPEYGHGSTCGTGTTVLAGAINLTAQAGFSAGNGTGSVLTIPAGEDFCLLTSANVQISGWVQSAPY